jgi:hypothetical protein
MSFDKNIISLDIKNGNGFGSNSDSDDLRKNKIIECKNDEQNISPNSSLKNTQ